MACLERRGRNLAGIGDDRGCGMAWGIISDGPEGYYGAASCPRAHALLLHLSARHLHCRAGKWQIIPPAYRPRFESAWKPNPATDQSAFARRMGAIVTDDSGIAPSTRRNHPVPALFPKSPSPRCAICFHSWVTRPGKLYSGPIQDGGYLGGDAHAPERRMEIGFHPDKKTSRTFVIAKIFEPLLCQSHQVVLARFSSQVQHVHEVIPSVIFASQ